MSATADARVQEQATLFGHPTGLYALFFAEMWERFSYYGMRALLVLYMIKGFLSYEDNNAYAVYGAYTALVYATPFIGGVLADRLLGQRRAVLMGGALMAAGHLLMTIESSQPFFLALALLIVGNGFFKPNISTIVGSLYPEGSPSRDSGFTIFYIGINLGAAMSGLLCGYVGETYGWHYGFGLATIGMLVGLAVFWAPTWLSATLIGVTGLGTAIAMFTVETDLISLAVNGLVGLALLGSATIACVAMSRGGLPDWAGQPKDPAALKRKVLGPINAEWAVYLGIIVAVPVLALLVQRNTIAGIVLSVFGVIALGSLLWNAIKAPKIERERMFVVLILMFFSMLFWAFFEQAGSSVNNFTDRNVDRVVQEEMITPDMVGQTLSVNLNQEIVGRPGVDGELTTLTTLDTLREEGGGTATVDLKITEAHVGMGLGGTEVRTSKFQSANPIFILLFGLLFSGIWTALGKRGLDPSVPVKFSLGLLQLGLGFAVLWYGAAHPDERGMVSMTWLLLGYLLHTTGELCLSPVGLSMVTKLAPGRIVSMVMGAWFLATAFSAYLAGLIAMLTGVTHGGDGDGALPLPTETLGVYGDVFGKIAMAAVVSAFILFALSPLLKKWMHGVDPEGGGH